MVSKRFGFVYVFYSPVGIKIGASHDPKRRVKEVRLASGLPVSEIFSFKVDDYYLVEKELHYRYRDFRGIGEWFDLTPDQVSDIERSLSSIEYEEASPWQ